MKKVNNKRRIKKLIKQTIIDILNPTLQIVSTSNGLPEYGSPLSAGMDIKADLWEIKEQFMKNAEIVRDADGTIANITIHPGGHCLVPTGIYTAFDGIYEIQVRPRSGNALKHRLTITNSPGTIDADYRNEWGIIIDNEDSEDFVIKQGDRIAQAVMAIVCHPKFEVKETVADLTGPNRGGGFGSTD